MVDAPFRPIDPGDRVGPYRIERRIGEGGMGTVFRAIHVKLKRPVALKLLRPDQCVDDDSRERFRREVRIASRLVHPHLVQTLDCEVEGDTPYLAMELVDGEDLKALLVRERRLGHLEALRLIQQAAEGVGELHAHGVVHRDLKPANILLTRSRDVKLGDFGLARREAGTLLTQPGVMVGTLSYMAPELYRGEEATPSSDLWSLGTILFELVTGERPVANGPPIAMVTAILTGRIPRADAVVPTVPREVADLIAALLTVPLEARLGDAVELARRAAALRKAGGSGPAPRVGAPAPPDSEVTPAPSRRGLRTRTGAVVTGLVASVLTGTMVAALMRRPPPVDGPARFTVSAAEASAAAAPASASAASARASGAPSVSATLSASGSTSVPEGPSPNSSTLFEAWKRFQPQLPLLRNPRTAGEAAAQLARMSPLIPGDEPEAWLHWIELGRWLETSSRAPAPRGSKARLDSLETLPGGALLEAHRAAREAPLKELYSVVLGALRRAPADGVAWLLLGLDLDREDLAGPANRAYEQALVHLQPADLDAAPEGAWRALVRALSRVPGRNLETEWERWLGSDATDRAWKGLASAVSGRRPAAHRRLLEHGAFGPRRSDQCAQLLGLEVMASEEGFAGAAAVWERYLIGKPDSERIRSLLAFQLLSFGLLDRARPHLDALPRNHWLVELAQVCVAGDGESLRSDPGAFVGESALIMATVATVHIERGNLAEAERIHAMTARYPPVVQPELDRISLLLLASGSTAPAVAPSARALIVPGLRAQVSPLLLIPSLARAAARKVNPGWFDEVLAQNLGVFRAAYRSMWLSRQGRLSESLDELARSPAEVNLVPGIGEVALEVATRPLWHAALGVRVAPEVLDRARWLKLVLRDPLNRLLDRCRAGDWGPASLLAQAAHLRYPRDYFLVCALWEAELAGNAAQAVRRRADLRAHVRCVRADWLALAQLEPRVAGPAAK